MSKIGILGGTFDPIHNGHLLLAKQAYEEYHMDQIWFMPSANPPHKQDRPVTDFQIRSEMVQLAIREYPDFVYSDFEIHRTGKSYTAQTLALLNQQYPWHDFYFIIGADSLFQLECWYHPEQVFALTTLFVAERECKEEEFHTIEEKINELRQRYQAKIYRLHCKEMNVSSEELRQIASQGADLGGLVPAPVIEYIHAHQLYRR